MRSALKLVPCEMGILLKCYQLRCNSGMLRLQPDEVERSSMIRKIVHIDEGKCTGCGLCVDACHEGAIGMVGGKARLLRDDYCDGLGDCLPACPADAIRIIEREAGAYDEAAVIANQMAQAKAKAHATMPATGCPGSQAKRIDRSGKTGAHAPTAASPIEGAAAAEGVAEAGSAAAASTGGAGAERVEGAAPADARSGAVPSQLSQWPVQIKLAPVNAPYFDGSDLLVAADCCAFAYGSFHEDFIKGRITLVGCPKLDGVDYAEKLTEIMAANSINSVTVCRMEVPCCGGIESAVQRAVQASGRDIPCEVVTISTAGDIL